MLKKYHYFIIGTLLLLTMGTTAFAGETFSIYTSSYTPSYNLHYISSASLPFTSSESIILDSQSDDYYWYYFNWSFNNTLTLNNSVGKYIYGAISVTCDLYIPNPNTSKWSWFSGVISGQPIITETLKIYPQIMTTAANHYIYKLIYVFDGYCPQNAEIPGPIMTISNVSAKWIAATIPGNEGLTVTGTCAENYNYLRFEDTPLDRGLASVIATGIDDSVKVDMIMSYLYDIRENDLLYYNTLTSQAAQIITSLGNISSRLLIVNNSINMGFEDVQTILDLFPDYMETIYEYWEQLLYMNQGQQETAEAQSSAYAEAESKSDELLQGLGEINFPSISAQDLDIFAGTDPSIKTNFFTLIGTITNNTFITRVLIIVITGMIIGFVLYGKKS